MAEIKIDWNLDSSERLTEEIKASDNEGAIKIGNHILKCFKTNDQLAKDYKDRKITLNKIWKHIMDSARAKLNGQSGYIEPAVIYGWAKDYIQDVKIKIDKSSELTLTKVDKEELKKKAEEEFINEQKEKLKKKTEKKIKKEKKKIEESGQVTLF